jgi:hypothetical protein
MPIHYEEDLNILPLPLNETMAAVLYRQFQKKIEEAGSRDGAVSGIVDTMYASLLAPAASELSRLQQLYVQIYTRSELEQLILNSLTALGLKD